MVASTVNGPVIANGNVPNGNIKEGLLHNGAAAVNGSAFHGRSRVGRFPRNIKALELMKRSAKLWKYMTFKQLIASILAFSAFIFYCIPMTPYLFPVFVLLLIIPVLSVFLGVRNFIYVWRTYSGRTSKIDDYIEFVDEDVKSQFTGKFIPIRDLYELYADGKLNFKRDVLECLEHRDDFVSYKFQWWHFKFFFQKFVPEMFIHDQKQDREQVCDHYNRGNDFYRSFLGPLMIYTSGLQYSDDDTLEDMQYQKLREVCNKVQTYHF